jgi:hypothetical protein
MMPLATLSTISLGATPGGVGEGATYLRLSNIVDGRIVGTTQSGAPPVKGWETRLRAGDILMRSRGPDLSAAVIGEGNHGCFATADVFVIRPDLQRVDPAYLATFLSLPATQAALAADAQGAIMARLNRPTLAQLAIPLPPLSQQRVIGELALAGARERELVHEIAELSHRLRQELLHRAMEKARTGEAIPRHGHIPGPNDAVTSSVLPSAPLQKASNT